jgi:tetratricopeptide (TPR) repeat protein
VAVKVLRPDLAAALGPERFLREIEIAANLTHPHIVPLYDSGEADGFLYYVLPYIEGESLRAKLAREGELPIADAVRILRDVVDALTDAHAHGVVHRDIKPDNVLLTKHHAVVTDFGVAKAVSEATGREKLTTAGVALGTPAYMAPEQAVADPHIDHRADIYAVGAVAYELLTGRPPFTGTTPQMVLSAHVTEVPEPVTKDRHAVPPALAQLVMRCLEKKAADRWQSAEELLPQLEALVTPSGGITPTDTRPVAAAQPINRVIGLGLGAVVVVLAATVTSILLLTQRGPTLVEDRVVVGALENRTGDASLDDVGRWAADWITQGLQTSGIVDVVPSLTATQSSEFVRQQVADGHVGDPIRALAEETRAGIVVSGAFYRLQDSVQFQVQVTDARDDELLHALEPVTSAFDTPEEGVEAVRQRVIGALALSLDESLAQNLGFTSEPPTFDAYRRYTDGVDAYADRDYRGSLSNFYRALELDSTFNGALLYATLAHSMLSEWAQIDSLLEIADRRRDRLTPYDRLVFDAVRHSTNGDREACYRTYRRAAALAPGSRAVYNWAREARRTNRPREAVEALRQLDPERGAMRGRVAYWSELTVALHMLGEHRQELEEARRARQALPNRGAPIWFEERALAALGRVDEIELHDQALGLSSAVGPGRFAWLATELRAHGQPEAAERIFELGIERHVRGALDSGSTLSYNQVYMLYEAGHWEEARSAAEANADTYPNSLYARGFVATAAARMGDSATAREISEWFRQLDRPYDRGLSTRWRAYIAAALGEEDNAVKLLEQAAAEGRSYDTFWRRDLDFFKLRDYPPFQELIRPKG